MLDLAAVYGATALTLLVGDGLWLSYFGKHVFKPMLGDIVRAKPRLAAVAAFYLLYPAMLLVFPLSLAGDPQSAAVYGAAFGFAAYMTYDLTNLATLKPWTVKLAAMDVAWGTILTALACVAGALA